MAELSSDQSEISDRTHSPGNSKIDQKCEEIFASITINIFLEKRVKTLKRQLEGWREVILPIHSIFLWGAQWHPALLAGVNTIIFLMLYIFDPSVLTTVSLFGLLALLLDYIVPTLTASLCRSDAWTGAKEKKLEEICRDIATVESKIKDQISGLRTLKDSKPKRYYLSVILTLLFLAWIGNMINNLFLTFIVVTILELLPGAIHHGILQKNYEVVSSRMNEIINRAKMTVEGKKDN